MNWTAKEILQANEQQAAIVARGRMPSNPVLDYAVKLTEFFMYDATCPCCGRIETCEDDCTFVIDCPEDYLKMKAVREILFK